MPTRKPISPIDSVIANGKREIARVQHIPKPKKGATALHPALQLAIDRARVKKSAKFPTGDPVAWIEQNFYIPETRRAIELAPYQKRALREALSLDEQGNLKYSVIIWADIKKSGKSAVAAAVADYVLSNIPYASTKFIANDLKQADSRSARALRTSFQLNPKRLETVKITPSGYKIEYLENHSVMESIPLDFAGEAGGNDDAIFTDELWAGNQEAHKRTWTELTLSPLKQGRSFRWISSYAGFVGESELLWNLYMLGVDDEMQQGAGGTRFDWANEFDPPLNVFHNDTARVFCMWNTVPRHEWQTPDYYASEAAILTPNEFRRIHQNEWVSAQETFITKEWWDACKPESLTPYEDSLMVVGIDAAVSGDCFGIVGVTRKDKKVTVRFVRKWTPPSGGKLQFSDPANPDNMDYPEGVLRWLSKQYKVIEFAYDPYQLHDLATRLQKEGVGWFRPFNQQKERLISDKQLYDLIVQRAIEHDGNPDLTAHVLNANAEAQGVNKERIRIVKRADNLKIDLCVCLSMASAEAMRLRISQ